MKKIQAGGSYTSGEAGFGQPGGSRISGEADFLDQLSIGVIASFRKIKKLIKDTAVIIEALKESSLLVVSPDEKKVRRLHPLPVREFKDPNPKLCTVLVENLPENHSKENIKRIFGQVGSIKSICICDPHAAEDLKKNIKAEKPFSNKAVVDRALDFL